MRKKTEERVSPNFGVTEGFDFGPNIDEIDETDVVPAFHEGESQRTPSEAKYGRVNGAEHDSYRNYGKYHTRKPKRGNRGGVLGRPSVDEKERKVQFSLTCTPSQKKRFTEAAQKEHRKLPEFICLAVDEYIDKHGL